MRKLFTLLAATLLLLGAASCNKGKNEQAPADQTQQQLDDLNKFLDIVAISMDSINGQEQSLFIGKDGQRLSSKDQIRDNLKLLKYTVDEQKERIARLESQLAKRDDDQAHRLQAIITSLKSQLAEKDAMIARLEKEIESKNFSIAQLTQTVDQQKTHIDKLNTHVSDLNTHVDNLNTQVEAMEEESQEKDIKIASQQREVEKLTTAYYRFGTKDELLKLGILQGSGLARKKFNASGVNNANFRTISTGEERTFTIPGRKPEIMTQHPAGSYTLSGNTLTITNPARFWSVSHYLVVKYK